MRDTIILLGLLVGGVMLWNRVAVMENYVDTVVAGYDEVCEAITELQDMHTEREVELSEN
jgi:hypothetical protein